jgi:hypothetical protein
MNFTSIFGNSLFYLLVYFSLYIGPYLGISKVATNFIIPFSFLYFLYKSKTKGLFKNNSIFLFGIFFLWTNFCSLFAIDYHQAFITQKKFLIVFMYACAIHLFSAKSITNSLKAYYTFIIGLFLIIGLTIYSSSIFSLADIGNVRLDRFDNSSLDNELLGDTNNFGYFLFLGLTSAFLLYFIYFKSIFNKLLLIILIIAGFAIIMLTASRGSYIIFILVVIGNILIGFIVSGVNRIVKLAIVIIVVVSVPSFTYYQSLLIKDSILQTRFDYAKEEKSPRELHMYEAISVGLKHPVLGVGGGNYAVVPKSFEQGSFSHNTYTEAFANYGFPGLILLVIFYFEFLGKTFNCLWKKDFRNKKSLYFLISYLFAFLVYNIFYVTYLTMEFMGMFFLARTYLDHLIQADLNKTDIFIKKEKIFLKPY